MYDIAIIGGGLAGLSSSIQLSKAGLNVILIEKKSYPFHRVCGEYISLEVLPFLKRELDFNPFDVGAVKIDHLNVTSPKGNTIALPLDLGGFGLSRYQLDLELSKIAKRNGVTILEKTNVLDIEQLEGYFSIKTNHIKNIDAKMAIGTFGKRSNLDRQLNRKTFYQRSPYIGVKHHIKIDGLMPENYIALHNFKNGYCGISRVEEDIYCLCYLSHKNNLKIKKSIPYLEQSILSKNPILNQIFNEAEFVWEKPLVINEVGFAPKTLRENGVWMSGDTAGMIAPLCGNGMAMAFHSSYLMSKAVKSIFKNLESKENAFLNYEKNWNKHFKLRLAVGRNIQKMFGNEILTEMLIRSLKIAKPVTKQLVKLTHGQAF